jgi:hypothetical protein
MNIKGVSEETGITAIDVKENFGEGEIKALGSRYQDYFLIIEND